MKLKEDFVLKEVAGAWVVLPLGDAVVDFTGMLTLNETGKMLWHVLENGSTREELAKALTEEYDVSYEQALCDVDEYVDKLVKLGCLEI